MAKNILGVGFLLFIPGNGEGPELFTIEELHDKPSVLKKKGMKTIPLETYEPRDENVEGTVERLFHEEMGIPMEQIQICQKIVPTSFPGLLPGRGHITHFYGYGIYRGNRHQNFQPRDNDIVFDGWKTIDQLLREYTRIEVAPILKHFVSEHYPTLLARLLAAA